MIADSLKVFSSNDFDWTGYHGYTTVREMPPDIGTTESFAVRSERTGKIRLFNLAQSNCQPDGTVIAWIFDSEAGDDFVSITVWNDHSSLVGNQ